MKRFPAHPFVVLLLALVAALVPATASAAEVRQGDRTVVAAGETIDDDLYVFGGSLDVQGTVNGDVIFFGGTSTIGGLITGDLLVMGGATNITGVVLGSVRASGGTVNISGRADQDVVVAAGSLDIAPRATLGRDLLAAIGSVNIAAPIARNVLVGGGDVTLAAPVGGDIRAEAGTLRLANGAAVQGTLAYSSERQAEIASGAAVAGGIQRNERAAGADFWAPLAGRTGGVASLGAVVWLRALVGIFVLGLALLLLAPASMRTTARALRSNAGASLGYGILLLVGIPIVATLVFALGLLVGGWWLGLVLIFLYALALGVGYIVSAILMGDLIIARLRPALAHPVWGLLAGVVALGLVALLPIVGAIVSGVAMVAGLGALGIRFTKGAREQRRPVVAPTTTAPVVPVPVPA
jgi:hypothetical protein